MEARRHLAHIHYREVFQSIFFYQWWVESVNPGLKIQKGSCVCVLAAWKLLLFQTPKLYKTGFWGKCHSSLLPSTLFWFPIPFLSSSCRDNCCIQPRTPLSWTLQKEKLHVLLYSPPYSKGNKINQLSIFFHVTAFVGMTPCHFIEIFIILFHICIRHICMSILSFYLNIHLCLF